MEIRIDIERASVLGIVEGLSATIAQHNGGEPSFDALWASDAESAKLDIWWRDGATDLEERLTKWSTSTTGQYVLQASGGDLQLELDTDDRWSERLTGLLSNKVQQYMIHVVMVGWLSDFKDVVAPDYKAMAASDLMSVQNILLYRELTFEEFARKSDVEKETSDAGGIDVEARKTDVEKETGDAGGLDVEARKTDVEKETGDAGGVDGEARKTDVEKETGDAGGLDVEARKTDVEKETGDAGGMDGEARKTDVEKETGDVGGMDAEARKTDVEKETGDVGGMDGEARKTDNTEKSKKGGGDIAISGRKKDVAKESVDGQMLEGVRRDRDDLYRRPHYYDRQTLLYE